MTDLTGKEFGRLTIVRRAGKDAKGQTVWLCTCCCGEATRADTHTLERGHKRSCGCLRRGSSPKSHKCIDCHGEINDENRVKSTSRGKVTYRKRCRDCFNMARRNRRYGYDSRFDFSSRMLATLRLV